MTVRPVTATDIDALIELANGVANEDRWVTAEPGDPRFTPEYWLTALQYTDGVVFAACDVDDVVGLLRVKRQNDGRHAVGLMIREGQRRRGHGKALLDAAVQWAREHRIRALQLGVFARNIPARRLYERNGFKSNSWILRLVAGDGVPEPRALPSVPILRASCGALLPHV